VTLYLTEADAASLFEPADAVPIVEDSFRRFAAGEVHNQPRVRLPMNGGHLALMGATDRRLGYSGIKTYSATAMQAVFVVVLFHNESGDCAGVLEANRLGQLRTGGASGVAAKYLARTGASTLGIIGCGFQAETQVACIRAAVPTIERVVAYCRSAERLAAFCERVGAEPAESHHAAVEDADIVVTATTSKDPVLRGEWLRPGALVCAIGANHPSRRELDNVVLERARFVCCDSREQSKLESGDLIDPVRAGVLDWLEVHELQEVVADAVRGREADDDIVVFKSNGMAAWDVAIGAAAIERARERGVGG
jgi:alanine dehydrogenase